MKPYYQDESCTIYHGDCREILPTLEPVDLVLTDPPYGINEDGGKFRGRKGGGHRVLPKMGWDRQRPSPEMFQCMLLAGEHAVIWGGNYFADLLPASRGWLYWDKRMGGDFSDGELAYTTRDMVLKSYSYCNKEHGKQHPTQKPVPLIKWCLSFFPDARTVLDPFMGSGTTLRAAKDLGLKAIGIELEEKYCEIAAKRLSQQVLAFA